MNRLLSFLAAALVSFGAAADDEVAPLLKAADRWRMAQDGLQVETQIQVLNKDGTPEKERLYTVFAQGQHRSLVLMRSPAEQGQKVLMLGDDFWLLMPNSQRPLRITPMQKLLGDASTGDIATLSWAEDYEGSVAGEEACGDQACLHLSLRAKRRAVSYQRIELWIGKSKREPVKADLYVQSDKLAKQARFVMDKPAAPTAVAEMILLDQISNHQETRVRYLARHARTVPETWLNPMFLARNPGLE